MVKQISSILAEHAAAVQFEDLSPGAVEATKKSLLDAIGVTLAASGLGEGCKAFADLAAQAGGTPESTIIGFGKKVPAAMAALANGAMAHALDFEDAFDNAPIHPNAAVVAAALPVEQAVGSVSGRQRAGMERRRQRIHRGPNDPGKGLHGACRLCAGQSPESD